MTLSGIKTRGGAAGMRDVLVLPAAVFCIAFALRAIVVWQLSSSGLWDYLRLDPLYYHDWARRIASGEPPGGGTFEMTPLYAWTIGWLWKAAGYGLLLPRLLGCALGAGTCALSAVLADRIFGRAQGWIAGLMMAAYGPALFHDTQIMKTVLTVALSTAAAAALYFSRGRSLPWLAAGGALTGLTALCQENINVILPFILMWIVWAGHKESSFTPRLARIVALVIAFSAVVAPVTLRNYRVSGDFVLITSGGGEVFYTGNNEFSSGKYSVPAFVRPDPFFEHEDFRAEAARRLGHPVTRKESDAFWWKQGWMFITQNPGRYLALLWDKLATFFNDYERPDNYSYYNFKRFIPLLRAPIFHFGWVAPLALVGLVISARLWGRLLPIHATMGAYVLSSLLFFTQDRYRMPLMPLLAVFAAHTLVWLTAAARARDLKLLAPSAIAVAALAIFVCRDPGNTLPFEAQNEGILGEMYLHADRPDEAIAAFTSGLDALRGYGGDSAGQQHLRVAASCHYGIALAIEAQREARGEAAGGGRGAHAEGAANDPHADDLLVGHLRAAAASAEADMRRDASGRLGAIFERRLGQAEARHKAGYPGEALALVQGALADDLTSDPLLLADAHYGEALIYLNDLKDAPQAARHFEQVLRLNPSHPRAAWIAATLETLRKADRHDTK